MFTGCGLDVATAYTAMLERAAENLTDAWHGDTDETDLASSDTGDSTEADSKIEQGKRCSLGL